MTNYQSFTQRIKQANNQAELDKLSTSLDRLYAAGMVTISEFSRLDGKILDRAIAIEPESMISHYASLA